MSSRAPDADVPGPRPRLGSPLCSLHRGLHPTPALIPGGGRGRVPLESSAAPRGREEDARERAQPAVPLPLAAPYGEPPSPWEAADPPNQVQTTWPSPMDGGARPHHGAPLRRLQTFRTPAAARTPQVRRKSAGLLCRLRALAPSREAQAHPRASCAGTWLAACPHRSLHTRVAGRGHEMFQGGRA
ncbi:hypothetical protein NDU88_003224 [Pleurodeles waltl]|uniref:Uncharacterized protein n=1 Tax=Pleurodeles waltl TaxID=8319 RepID=A0AAV7PHJ6_PLEWA|nr:hypothetical protein NDU88_003224 [Pleurodeles waltl]